MTTTSCLVLTADLTIYHAMELKHQLLAALAATDDLALDLAEVREMDAAGLQLLLLLKKEAQCAGKHLSFVAPGPAVRETIGFCNLDAELGAPFTEPVHQASGAKGV